eukprot:5637325-Amphidinium_carterae.1
MSWDSKLVALQKFGASEIPTEVETTTILKNEVNNTPKTNGPTFVSKSTETDTQISNPGPMADDLPTKFAEQRKN